MSALSGLGSKADKHHGKYKGIDINNLYRGNSSSPKLAQGSSQRHGLQSIGKIARRMPPPANLPSLRSENLRNGLNSVPVPQDNSGWTKEEGAVEGVAVSGNVVKSTAAVTKPQMSGGNLVSQPPTGGLNTLLWSGITSRRPGSFLDQKSALFQEEFPQLAMGIDAKSASSPRAVEEQKEIPYGPGPSLRPQNVASWREGGGRGVVQHSSPPASPVAHSPPASGPHTGYSTSGGLAAPAAVHHASTASGMLHETPRPPIATNPQMFPFGGPIPAMMPMRPPGVKSAIGPLPVPMGHVPLMAPAYHSMMMPPFTMQPGFMAPHYSGTFVHPMLPRPPFVNPPDFRFRAMPPFSSMNVQPAAEEKWDRPSIIKTSDLEMFDKLSVSDEGWARNIADVDYSERLVFSDEEDGFDQKKQTILKRQSSDESVYGRHRSQTDREHLFGGMNSENTVNSQKASSHRTHCNSESSSSHLLDKQGNDPQNQPNSSTQKSQKPRASEESADEDEYWSQLRKQQSMSMSAAVERARKRREAEERKLQEEQMAAAREKLRQLDEKFGKKLSKSEREKTKGDSIDSGRRRSETSEASEHRNLLAGKPSAFGGSLDIAHAERQQAMSPATSSTRSKAEFQRSESLPGTLPSAPSHPTPPSQPVQYRMPNAEYWPLPYDMRAWAGMQYQQYMMMDSHFAAQHSSQEQAGAFGCHPSKPPDSARNVGKSGEASDRRVQDAYSCTWPWHDYHGYGMHPTALSGHDQQPMRNFPFMAHYYGFNVPDYKQQDFESTAKKASVSPAKTGQKSAASQREPNLSNEWSQYPEGRLHHHLSSDDLQGGAAWHGSTAAPKKVEMLHGQSFLDFAHVDNVEPTPTVRKMDADPKPSYRNISSSEGGSPNADVDRNDRCERLQEVCEKDDDDDDKLDSEDVRFDSSRYHWNTRSADWKENRRPEESGSSNQRKLWQPSGNRSSCPPPIPVEQARQNVPSVGSYMSLKRTHSSVSNSSLTSSDRKTESPKAGPPVTGPAAKGATKMSQPQKVKEPGQQNRHNKGRDSKQEVKDIVPHSHQTDVVPSTASSKLSDQLSKLSMKDTVAAEQKGDVEKFKMEMKEQKNDQQQNKTTGPPDHPPTKKSKSSSRSRRRRKENAEEIDLSKINGGSREFVRGGGGRMRISGPRPVPADFPKATNEQNNPRGSEDVVNQCRDNNNRNNDGLHAGTDTKKPAAVSSSKDSSKMDGEKQSGEMNTPKREVRNRRPARERPPLEKAGGNEKAGDRSKQHHEMVEKTSGNYVDRDDRNLKSKQSQGHLPPDGNGGSVPSRNQSQRKDQGSARSNGPRNRGGHYQPQSQHQYGSANDGNGSKPLKMSVSITNSSKAELKNGQNSFSNIQPEIANASHRGEISCVNPKSASTLAQLSEQNKQIVEEQSQSNVDNTKVTEERHAQLEDVVDILPEQSDPPSKKASPADFTCIGTGEEWETASEGSDGGTHQRRQPLTRKNHDGEMVDNEKLEVTVNSDCHHLWSDDVNESHDCEDEYQHHTEADCNNLSSMNEDDAHMDSGCTIDDSRDKLFDMLTTSDDAHKVSTVAETINLMCAEKSPLSEYASHQITFIDPSSVWKAVDISKSRNLGVSENAVIKNHDSLWQKGSTDSDDADCTKQDDVEVEVLSRNSLCIDNSQLLQICDGILGGKSWSADPSNNSGCWWSSIRTEMTNDTAAADVSPHLGSLIAEQNASLDTATVVQDKQSSLSYGNTNSYSGVIGSHRVAHRHSLSGQERTLKMTLGESAGCPDGKPAMQLSSSCGTLQAAGSLQTTSIGVNEHTISGQGCIIDSTSCHKLGSL